MESIRETVLTKYLDLEQPTDKIFCTYVFVDGTLQNLRCKTRVLSSEPLCAADCPEWTFCGKGSYQYHDDGPKSELYLVPVALFRDPFLRGRNKLVLCEVLDQERKPIATNTRRSCCEAMKMAFSEEPWFGIEQEYMILEKDDKPLGWPRDGGVLKPLYTYFYGVGEGNIFGRNIVIAHLKACAYAGIKIGGTNAECNPSQWEYQVGPLPGVGAADHLWMSRYILLRVGEDFGVKISFDPRPCKEDGFLGSGGHVNFSTASMRQENGIRFIEEAIQKLKANADHHLSLYDPDKQKRNAKRLNGMIATPSSQFDADSSSRKTSVRIPRQVVDAGKGYLEDRRPGSNVEPYRATEAIVRTVCLS